MVVEPKVKGSLSLTAHPYGCREAVKRQVEYVKNAKQYKGSKKALIIGASSGYGLATRISLAFGGSKADTIGVSYETASNGRKTGTAGWWNNIFFKQEAEKEGLLAKNFVGDAFSYEMKDEVIKYIKEEFGGKVDIVVYSLASGVRTDPKTGITHKSSLKSRTGNITGPTLNIEKGCLEDKTMENATDEELEETVKVMGGEDWDLWVKALCEADVLASGCKTYAYSYLGPELISGIYRDGTLGAAKRHLEQTARELSIYLKEKIDGDAYVSVNKALVTKASAYIPIFPLYAALLYKVMKNMGIHEGTIEQTHRLFADMIYGDSPEIDDERRIRPDNWELRDDVQEKISEILKDINHENFKELSDYKGYVDDFMNMNGFGFDNVDYSEDIDLDELAKLKP
jgi:enoyl-[acyl-carrier protein] reductase/trans-2-enoyl-CoA reductase (NAD+)